MDKQIRYSRQRIDACKNMENLSKRTKEKNRSPKGKK